MTKEKDISGNRYGRLVAIKKDHSTWDKEKRISRNFWLFRCDCGQEKVIDKYSVIRGKVFSCGCLNKEKTSERNFKHGLFYKDKRLYRCWQGMKNRCYNETRDRYKNYGARGITVCEEWKDSFVNFYNWAMSNGYKDDLTIDRIDVNGNYTPSNCRWASKKEQANNTQKTRWVTLNGVTKPLMYWAEKYNLKRASYYYYHKKGLTDEQIFLGVR